MKNRRTAVLFALALISFLVPYMGAALNLALPEIALQFNLEPKKLGWINSSFLIATAVFQVPLAKVADIIGRKKTFCSGVMLFGVSSIACACAWDFSSLMAFRVLSGIGGAMIFGTNLAILSATFENHERGKAMGILTAVVYMALAAGPFFGGIFTHYLGWESVFYIPGIILLIGSCVIPFLIKQEWIEQSKYPFDKIGSLIYGVSLFCLIFGFSELPTALQDQTYMVAPIAFVAGIIGMFVFYNYEKKIEHPVFQVSIFNDNKTFTFSSLAAFFSYAATMAVSFMISLYLMLVRGLDAKSAGLVLISSAIVQSIASFYAGRLADKFDPSKIAFLGMALNVVGLLGLIFVSSESSILLIIVMLLFLGLGFGLFSSPNIKIIMGSVESKLMNQASATVGTMRLTGQAFSMGIAVMAFALFVGDSPITEANFDLFMKSWKFVFAICAFFCAAGTLSIFLLIPKR